MYRRPLQAVIYLAPRLQGSVETGECAAPRSLWGGAYRRFPSLKGCKFSYLNRQPLWLAD